MRFSSIFLSVLSLISFLVSALPTNQSPPSILSPSGVSELNVGDVIEGFLPERHLLVYDKILNPPKIPLISERPRANFFANHFVSHKTPPAPEKKYSYRVMQCLQQFHPGSSYDIPLDYLALTLKNEPDIRNWFAAVRFQKTFETIAPQREHFSKLSLLFKIPPGNMPLFKQLVQKSLERQQEFARLMNSSVPMPVGGTQG